MRGRTIVIAAALALTAGALRAEEKLDAGPALANDMGPTQLDVSSYPKEMQDNFKVLQERCSRCHQAHRTFNAQYVQPDGDTDAQNKAIEALKKSNPELFSDKNVWQLEADVWKRYVKRMMAKPGFAPAGEDEKTTKEIAGKIYKFLVYDSNARKLKDPKGWAEARKKMLAAFKAKYPDEYAKTYAQK